MEPRFLLSLLKSLSPDSDGGSVFAGRDIAEECCRGGGGIEGGTVSLPAVVGVPCRKTELGRWSGL